MKFFFTLARLWLAGLFSASSTNTASTPVPAPEQTPHNIVFTPAPRYVTRTSAEAARALGCEPRVLLNALADGHIKADLLPNPRRGMPTMHLTQAQFDAAAHYVAWRAVNPHRKATYVYKGAA